MLLLLVVVFSLLGSVVAVAVAGLLLLFPDGARRNLVHKAGARGSLAQVLLLVAGIGTIAAFALHHG